MDGRKCCKKASVDEKRFIRFQETENGGFRKRISVDGYTDYPYVFLAKRAWDRAPYSWNMVNLFLFGCHVTERRYASTDCTGRGGREGYLRRVLANPHLSFILDIHNMVN